MAVQSELKPNKNALYGREIKHFVVADAHIEQGTRFSGTNWRNALEFWENTLVTTPDMQLVCILENDAEICIRREYLLCDKSDTKRQMKHIWKGLPHVLTLLEPYWISIELKESISNRSVNNYVLIGALKTFRISDKKILAITSSSEIFGNFAVTLRKAPYGNALLIVAQCLEAE